MYERIPKSVGRNEEIKARNRENDIEQNRRRGMAKTNQ